MNLDRSNLVVLLAAAASLWLAGSVHAGSVRLKLSAHAGPGPVRLAEVAQLQGDDAQKLADVVVAQLDQDHKQLRLTLAQVRAALDEAGANWGLLSLGGFTHCRVQLAKAVVHTPPPVPAQDAAANPTHKVTPTSPLTLRSKVEQALIALAKAKPGDLRITFGTGDAKLLDRDLSGGRYQIQPMTRSAIGRVPVVVRQYQAGRIARTFTINADVARRYDAVVMVRSLGRGDRFTKGDLAVKTVYIDNTAKQPVTDVSLVVGQQAASMMPKGSVVYPDRIQSPVLVKRGDLVTVRCMAGALVIRTVGRAADNGSIDDTVRIRNESTHETYVAVVTGQRQVMVKLGGSKKTSARRASHPPLAAAAK